METTYPRSHSWSSAGPREPRSLDPQTQFQTCSLLHANLVATIFPKIKTLILKSFRGKPLKLELGVGGGEEGERACEGLELVFQVKLLLSQNPKVYFQVRANRVFFNCLADLENLIRYCFRGRTWKSNSKQ